VALALICFSFLKPGPVRCGIERECLACIFEALFRIAGSIVISAQIDMGGVEFALSSIVERDRFLVARNRTCIVSQGLLRQSESVQSLDVLGIDAQCLFEFFSAGSPVVLYRE